MNKQYTAHLETLDSILNYLVNTATDYKVNFYLMSDEVFQIAKEESERMKSGSIDFDTIVQEIFTSFRHPSIKVNNLRLAILYLHSLKLITIDSDYILEITFEGLLKYTEGFVATYKSELYDQNRLDAFDKFQRNSSNRMMWINGVIALGTLVAMIYYFLEMISTPYCFCK